MKHSRFLRGGVVTYHPPPNQIPVEDNLDWARHWQDDLKRNRQPTLGALYPEPKQWVRNDEGGWTEALDEEAFKDAYTLWEWNVRNMRYHDWTDRRDPRTDIGYVHTIHQ